MSKVRSTPTARSIGIAGAALAATLALAGSAPAQDASPDPNTYLEDVHGPAALAKVKGWNAATLAALETLPGYAGYRARALDLLSDKRKLAPPERVIGDAVLNLWHDDEHPRGLWRVSPLAAFAAGRPVWRTLIDVDALSRAEGHKWAFKHADCLPPAYVRCMVALSDGGGDTVTQREFDLAAGRFVPGGFTLPPAKSQVSWAGPDELYVATDFGPGTLTNSGYPALVKRWRRGVPLAAAAPIGRARPTDINVAVHVLNDGVARWPLLRRQIDSFSEEVGHLAPDGRVLRSPLPTDAVVEDVIDGRLIATLRRAWDGHAAGSVVAYAIPDVLAGRSPAIETVFTPSARQAVEEVSASRGRVWIKYLDDVSGRLAMLTRAADGRWRREPVALPDDATIHLDAAATDSDLAFATVEGMLTPPTLYRIAPGAAPAAVQATPARFDAAALRVEQHFATSKDGARIPYYLVRRKDARGPAPALIHAYGGFALAQTPGYLVGQPYRSGPLALFWVEEGGAYVLANIRGGGEYGPAWHEATQRERHQNAFDDLYAVADDLIAHGVTAKGRIAVSGRSNGGLLAAATIVERPDLFGAAIVGSPLIDMRRYTHLLAGASWIAEYGDPDQPADWAFIGRYSPYQRLAPEVRYPTPFIYTSTLDDRVHPGHARKFAARLEALGDPFYYDEAIEGGHEAGVVPAEDAARVALEMVYLNKMLPPGR